MRSQDIARPLRRQFFKVLVAFGALLTARILPATHSTKIEYSSSMRALSPFLETLLPADSTPSASQIGVDKALLDRAQRQPALAGLLALGCAWLDAQARKRGSREFLALSASAREAVVSAAEQSTSDSLPGRFFAATRSLAFEQYYARPESWVGLGFAGPPQPVGFPDHAEAPTDERR